MRATRVSLVTIGVLLMAYGAVRLVTTEHLDQVLQVLTWAAAAVVLHDAILAPLAVAIGWLVHRLLPHAVTTPVAVVLLLVGVVTVVAIPVLDGAKAGGANRTLLDRDYTVGWMTVVGVVVVATAAAAALAALGTRRRQADGQGSHRR